VRRDKRSALTALAIFFEGGVHALREQDRGALWRAGSGPTAGDPRWRWDGAFGSVLVAVPGCWLLVPRFCSQCSARSGIRKILPIRCESLSCNPVEKECKKPKSCWAKPSLAEYLLLAAAHTMELAIYLVVGFSIVIGSWMLLAKVANRAVRIFLGAGALALLVSPTVVAGHGGAYIGPALFLWFIGRDIDVLRYCILPIAAGWLVVFLAGLVVSWLAITLSRK